MLSSVHTPRLLRHHLPPQQCCFTTAPTQPPSSQILTMKKALLSGETTSVDLTSAFLRRTEPHLKRFLYTPSDQTILQQAQELDNRIQNNEPLGPLAGVYFFDKFKDDLIWGWW
ncbi:hypothetical protein LIER_43132 [Lithospermum erythrorhizon]|uniref:Uncharacterized protein n=1 Tax=Lithospermum erythrorhizon TaxID=34254 RepID=A0AAV3PJB3_LITER